MDRFQYLGIRQIKANNSDFSPFFKGVCPSRLVVKSGDFKSPIALYPIGSRGFESRLGLNYQGSTREKKWQRSPHRIDESLARWGRASLPWILYYVYYKMEKLLQLLNDYSPLKDMSDEYCVKYWKVWIRTRLYAEPDVYVNYTLQVISKKFWFIQWLMDQNKIEFDRARDRSDFPLLYAGWWELYSDAEVIIATLSVEDDPIEFLVSILK